MLVRFKKRFAEMIEANQSICDALERYFKREDIPTGVQCVGNLRGSLSLMLSAIEGLENLLNERSAVK